jgi:hypothetical protein
LSKVAVQAGIPLEKFMADNTGTVTDLDKPITGKELLLCSPDFDELIQECMLCCGSSSS